MTADPRCALGPYLLMSESHPKPYLPAFSAAPRTADESVFCIKTSAPWSIRLCAASPSLGGSNHLLTQTTRVVTFGLTLCAPSVNESMLRMTSGIGIEPTTPSMFDFVMAPATTPAMYAPSYVLESYVRRLPAVL